MAILNVSSRKALSEVLGSYPLNAWVDYEVHPLSDVRHFFDTTIRTMGG